MDNQHTFNEPSFKIRAYGISELAQLYCPAITPSAARRKLNYWISLQPDLLEALRAAGYSHKVRTFTPSQVKLIIEAIGEP